MSSSPIRIAISGGGVAGASLLHALLQYAHLDVHIFESAAKFKEAGVAFGLTRNATAALSLVNESASNCLKRAGGVPMKGVRFHLAQGKDSGTIVYEADSQVQGKQTTTIVQRASFLHELLANVPEDRLHASKKLETVDHQNDGCLLLHFADGTTHECDILIGADGIHSTVRKIILGQHDSAAAPRNTGWWAIMTLQPYEKARSSFGEQMMNLDDAREYSWIGDNIFLLHNMLSDGKLVQFSVCSKDDEAEGSDRWHKTITAEEIHTLFTHVDHPEHLNKGIKERAIYFWDHPHASTYVDGPIAIVGDAAHATTPWQGAGGGFCIEDSLILSTLLGQASSPKEAVVALRVYNQLRRPRTQQLVDSSRLTGHIVTGKYDRSGLDAEELRKVLAPRWDFIVDFDIARHRDEALQLFSTELAKA